MADETLRNLVRDLYDEVVEAMADADREPTDAGYRLGVRRIAKAFFDKLDLFNATRMLPELQPRDVDAWYAGQEDA